MHLCLSLIHILVQYAANLAEENHIKPLRQIWLPPLPGLFYLDDLELTWDEKQIKLPVGLADDPQNQRQFPVYLDFISCLLYTSI